VILSVISWIRLFGQTNNDPRNHTDAGNNKGGEENLTGTYFLLTCLTLQTTHSYSSDAKKQPA